MADITMCRGDNCPLKNNCYRYTAIICCDYDDDGVMVEAQGEHYDIIGLLAAFIIMYSQKYGYDIDAVKKEVNSAIEIIMEQED